MEIPTTFFNHDAQAGGFYPKSHVGIEISGFGRHQNTIVEGIRGTGKTHILKMLSRYYLENFTRLRVLPIYISLAQISEHARKEPDEFRLHLYTHIVQRAIETVEANKVYLQSNKDLLERAIDYIRNLFGIKSKKGLDETLILIKQTADLLLFKLQFDLTSNNFRQVESEASSLSSSIESSMKSKGLIGAGVSGKLVGAISQGSEIETTMVYMGRQLLHKNAALFMIEFLKQIQVVMDLDYSLLLLDECSEASFSAQVEIFRLFKTIRGAVPQQSNKNACAFFVGTVYPRGETYYPTRRQDGFEFEPGQDSTMEFLQWDETDLESYISFFEGMTLNRAKEVLNYQGDFKLLCSEIFDKEDAFLLAAVCAHGIARRYWEIIKRAYDQNNKKIMLSRVSIAIQEIVNDQILGHFDAESGDTKFIHAILRSLTSKNINIRVKNAKKKVSIPQNIFFSLDRAFSEKLAQLVMYGAVHDKSRMRTKKKSRRPQPMYALDLAIAYTFRIIPQKTFAQVLLRDLPRCPANDYDQAIQVSSRGIKNIYESSFDTESQGDVEIFENIEESEDSETDVAIGTIRDYDGKKGSLVNEDGTIAIFQVNNIDEPYKKSLKIGETVSFLGKMLPNGEKLALKITKVSVKKQIEGIVKSYETEEFGFIEILDGGPDAFFLPTNLSEDIKKKLKTGDRVKVDVIQTTKGRQGINISIQTLSPKPLVIELNEIANYIINFVRKSANPVPLATIAFQLRNYLGDSVDNTQWFGYGSFKNLLLQLDLENLNILSVGPSYLYDPNKHKSLPAIPMTTGKSIIVHEQDKFKEKYPDLSSLAAIVHQKTGIPYLLPEEYMLLFDAIAECANQKGFHFSSSVKAVKDILTKHNISIAKSSINYVISGMHFSGYRFGQEKESGYYLAKYYYANVIRWCNNANMNLKQGNIKLIELWLTGDYVNLTK